LNFVFLVASVIRYERETIRIRRAPLSFSLIHLETLRFTVLVSPPQILNLSLIRRGSRTSGIPRGAGCIPHMVSYVARMSRATALAVDFLRHWKKRSYLSAGPFRAY